MKKGFTILELLLVIGVLSLLMAISIPVIRSIHATALKRRAQSEATLLVQAAMRYRAEYGFWPGQLVLAPGSRHVQYHGKIPAASRFPLIVSGPSSLFKGVHLPPGTGSLLHLQSNEVCQAFSRIDSLQKGWRKTNPLNPKGIRFLDLRNEGNIGAVSFPDPWENPYVLILGIDPRSTFTLPVPHQNAALSRISVSNVTAFAFSFGPEGAEGTNYIYSTGVR